MTLKLTLPLNENEKVDVSIAIEKIRRRSIETTYLEACVQFAEENNIDVEDIPKMIYIPLKHRIHEEALENNLLKEKRPNTGTLDTWM